MSIQNRTTSTTRRTPAVTVPTPPVAAAGVEKPGGKKAVGAKEPQFSNRAIASGQDSRVTQPQRVKGPGLSGADALRVGLSQPTGSLTRGEQKAMERATTWVGAGEALASHPNSKAVALAAMTTSEEMVMKLSPALKKDMAFLKQAALANPALVMPELQNEYLRGGIRNAFPEARQNKLLADPDVKAAVAAQRAALAAAPDIRADSFDNRRILAQLLHNRANPTEVDSRPTAVAVYPKSDWNGQFTGTASQLQDLTKAYRLMFYQVETDAEFGGAVKHATQNKPADLVIIGGHGEATLTAFGADDPARLPPAMRKRLEGGRMGPKEQEKLMARLAVVNEEKYLDFSDADIVAGIKDRIGKGANVVVMSCSTGKGGATGNNIANFLHGLLPQAHIHAPTEPVQNSGVVLNDKGLFEKAGFAEIGKAYVVGPQ